jgi:hypothetical protein
MRRIRLTVDLPVDEAHGMREGQTFDIQEETGDGSVLVRSPEGLRVLVEPEEFEEIEFRTQRQLPKMPDIVLVKDADLSPEHGMFEGRVLEIVGQYGGVVQVRSDTGEVVNLIPEEYEWVVEDEDSADS